MQTLIKRSLFLLIALILSACNNSSKNKIETNTNDWLIGTWSTTNEGEEQFELTINPEDKARFFVLDNWYEATYKVYDNTLVVTRNNIDVQFKLDRDNKKIYNASGVELFKWGATQNKQKPKAKYNDPVQQDIFDYVNKDLPQVAILESQAINSREKLAQMNSTGSSDFNNTLRNEIIPNYHVLIQRLEQIHPRTKELREIHKIYIQEANYIYNASILILDGLEHQDINEVINGKEKVDRGNRLFLKWHSSLLALGKKYHIEITK